jgi:hypothetical protein
MPLPTISIRSSSARRTVPIDRSATAFARDAPHGRSPAPDAFRSEDHIQRNGEPRIPVVEQELELLDAVGQIMSRLRACWPTHVPVGFAVTPRMCTRRAASSITNSTYRRLSSTVSTWNKSAPGCLGLRGQVLSPRQSRAVRRRLDAGPVRQQPHRARRDLEPQPHRFTVDAPVAPRRVLRRHPQDQRCNSGGIHGRLGGRPGVVQRRLTRSRCQRSNVSGVTNRWHWRLLGSSRVNAARMARSSQERRGLATCRRSTATSCRSTRISASLDAWLRVRRPSQPMS